MLIRERLPQYACLMRLDKPIGILLLLWPTLWALWLASSGHPDNGLLWVFIPGVILMRSAGCIINDLADRHLDCHVVRTCNRPLVSGDVKPNEALLLAALLGVAAFLLVLHCNILTIYLAFVEAALKGKPDHPLNQPSGIVSVRIDPMTGKRASSDDPVAMFEYFMLPYVPEKATEVDESLSNSLDGNAPSDGTEEDDTMNQDNGGLY